MARRRRDDHIPSSLNDRVASPSVSTPSPLSCRDKLGRCTRLQPPIIAVRMCPFSIMCLAITRASAPPVNDENIVKLGPENTSDRHRYRRRPSRHACTLTVQVQHVRKPVGLHGLVVTEYGETRFRLVEHRDRVGFASRRAREHRRVRVVQVARVQT